MPDDEDDVYRAARVAVGRVQDQLKHARSQVAAAATAFRVGTGITGIAWWDTLGEKLGKRTSVSASYRELVAALKAADVAVARAEAACDALGSAVRR